MKSYYNANYFKWQKNIGLFGGEANLFKFERYIKSTDKVVDFGSGGGYLLKQLHCLDKIGIEINSEARKSSAQIGIRAVQSPKSIPSNWADVIISNHALEHCERPLDELKDLKRILKPRGKIVFVVPHERNTRYYKGNISNHIYTWSEISAGNIFNAAGFSLVSVETIYHTWPPFYLWLAQYGGMKLFHAICKIYAFFNQDIQQIRIVAKK